MGGCRVLKWCRWAAFPSLCPADISGWAVDAGCADHVRFASRGANTVESREKKYLVHGPRGVGKVYLKGDRFLRCCLYRFALPSLLIRRATFCKRPPDHSVLDRQAWSTTCPFSRERMREHLGTVYSPGLFHLGRHRRRSSQHREREEAVTVYGLLLPVDYFESNPLVKDDIALLVRA